jgi:transcriptional regulator of acetoin/glycerol metabolism
MAAYPWPGNIRELESVIGNACMMADGKFLDVGGLPERIQRSQSPADEAFFSLEEISRRHVMRVLERVGLIRLERPKFSASAGQPSTNCCQG